MGILNKNYEHEAKRLMDKAIGVSRGLAMLLKYNLLDVERLATSGYVSCYSTSEKNVWDVPIHISLTIPYSLKPDARKFLFASGQEFEKRTQIGGSEHQPLLRETWKLQGLDGSASVEIGFERGVRVGEVIDGCVVRLKKNYYPVSLPNHYPTLDCPRKGY